MRLINNGPLRGNITAPKNKCSRRIRCIIHLNRRGGPGGRNRPAAGRSRLGPLVDEVGHERRPAGLVARPQAGPGVAVEVFVEEQLVPPEVERYRPAEPLVQAETPEASA